MKTLRPIAFVLATLLHFSLGTVSTWAQDDPSIEPEAGGQISGNLPDSRAGIITLEGLSGTSDLTGGAVPQSGFSYIHDAHYWDRNFYRVDTFLPYNLTPGTDYFYTNLMGAVTQGGDGVVNLGLGYGYYVEGWDRLFRTTAWLDIDDEPSSTLVALGAQSESLGKYFDTRAGVQIVVTDSTSTAVSGLLGTSQLIGNNVIFDGIQVTDTAFNQADFEIGGPVALLGDYGINMYGRGYFLSNFDTDRRSLGAGLRGEWTITEDITFNANLTHDDIFGTNTFLSIAVTTPDGAPQNVARPVPVRERFSKRSPRTGRIPNIREFSDVSIAATDAKTGNNLFIVYVDPNAAAPGNGTVESPYNSLEAARLANNPNVSAFYVDPNTTDPNINTNGLQVTDSFALLDNQYFLSSTVDQTIMTGNFGNLFLPGSGLANPLISNGDTTMNIPPTPVISLANWNVVSGFTIDGRNSDGDVAHTGIMGTGISGFEITRNNFQNVANGTVISHVGTDIGIFDDNIVTGDGFGLSSRGFSITHTGGTLDLSVQRNVVTNFPGEDVDADGMLDPGEDFDGDGVLDFGVGIEVIANGGTINAWDPAVFGLPVPPPPAVLPDKMFGILDNVSTGNGTGFVLQANNGATINADIQGNDFSNNVNPNTGARLEAFSGTLNILAFNSNLINNNAGNGLVIHADDPFMLGGGLINIFDMNNNSISGNGANTMENVAGTNNNGIFMFANNQSSINAHTGLFGFGLIGQGLYDNIIDNNAGAGLLAVVNNTSILNLDIEVGTVGSTMDNNGRDGLFFLVNNGSIVTSNIFNTSFIDNGGFGIGADVLNGSGLILDVGSYNVESGNTIRSNVGAGIGINAMGSSIVQTNILGNVIQDNQNDGLIFTPFSGDGIAIVLDESQLVNSNIDLNIIGELGGNAFGNSGHGILVTTTGSNASGIFGLTIGNIDGDNDNGNQIGDNFLDGIHLERSVASVVNDVVIEDNKIWNNFGDGIEIITRGTNNDQFDVGIIDNWIFANGGDGIGTLTFSDSRILFLIANNIIDTNGDSGIETGENVNDPADDRSTNGLITMNQIIDNGENGIQNSALNQSGLPGDIIRGVAVSGNGLRISTNLIDDNGFNGIFHNAAGLLFIDNNVIHDNDNHGVDIEGVPSKTVNMANNLIDFNQGDGIEYNFNDSSIDSGFGGIFILNSFNDIISNNAGRGVDILNQGDAISFIDFNQATVINNLQEGVYVVNTASTTQNQTDTPGTSLENDGDDDADATLFFQFRNGRVEGNGVSSGFGATGMLIRVGTTEILDNEFANTGSGVIANIDNNIMQGNQGHDFYVDAFVSTGTPRNNPVQDPLARLDLTFTNNMGDSIDVDAGNFAIFYENSSVQKSPWDLTRRRNATRLTGDGFFWLGAVNDTAADQDDFDVDDRFMPGFFNGADNSFNGFDLTFTGGLNAGLTNPIVDSTAAGNFEFAALAWPFAPANNDPFFVDFSANFYPGLGDSTFRVNQSGNSFSSGLFGFGTSADIRGIPRQGEEPSFWGVLP